MRTFLLRVTVLNKATIGKVAILSLIYAIDGKICVATLVSSEGEYLVIKLHLLLTITTCKA